MRIRKDFDNDYGYGYIEVITRTGERNTTYEVVVDGTYDDFKEEDVHDYILRCFDDIL